MRRFGLALLLCAAVFGISACSKSSENASSSASSSAAATNTQTPTTAATITTTSAPAEATAAASVAAASNAPRVSFTDIKGIDAEKAINDEAVLGIFGTTSGAFHPQDKITRGLFVRWLVTAENAYSKSDPAKKIHLAEGSDSTFVDVPPSNPNFKYIQGVANAGIAVGVDSKHFAPDRLLTREELVAIKVPVDEGKAPDATSGTLQGVQMRWRFTDVNSINKRYYPAIYDDYAAITSNNIQRVWGILKTFNPQKPVTRSEAALALQQVGDVTAEKALGK